jgi:LacI family transcriptional regulator
MLLVFASDVSYTFEMMNADSADVTVPAYGSLDPAWCEIGLVGFNQGGLDAQILKGINQFRTGKPEWVLRDAGHQDFLVKNLIRNHNLRGILANVTDHKRMSLLQEWGGPVIDLSGILPDSPFPQVGSLPGSIGELGAQVLHSKGLQRIVYVSGMNWTFEMDRWKGVRTYCLEHGLQAWWWLWSENKCVDSVHAESLPSLLDSSPFSAYHFLTQIPRPFAAFVAMDRMAVQLCDGCRIHQLHIPRDVAILGVDNNRFFCESCTPPLSSVILPGQEMGYAAAELLAKRMAGEEVPQFTRLAPIGIKERNSTP